MGRVPDRDGGDVGPARGWLEPVQGRWYPAVRPVLSAAAESSLQQPRAFPGAAGDREGIEGPSRERRHEPGEVTRQSTGSRGGDLGAGGAGPMDVPSDLYQAHQASMLTARRLQ